MTNDVTFIIPTRNRSEMAIRATEFCLALDSAAFSVSVLLIDGSDEDMGDALCARFQGDSRVTIFEQPDTVIGFMNACYFGVSKVDTRYATFMYDDDLISPYAVSLYARAVVESRAFAMGFGATNATEKIYPFEVIDEVRSVDPIALLSNWFGQYNLKYTHMPYSPICCIVRSEILRQWVRDVQAFGDVSTFRRYHVLQRNVGGDLMIYLSGLLAADQPVLLADTIIGQFSETEGSITNSTNQSQLHLGYWVARIWAIEKLITRGHDRSKLGQMAGYIALTGIMFCLTDLLHGRFRWVGSTMSEIVSIVRKLGATNVLKGTVTIAAKIARYRFVTGSRYVRPA